MKKGTPKYFKTNLHTAERTLAQILRCYNVNSLPTETKHLPDRDKKIIMKNVRNLSDETLNSKTDIELSHLQSSSSS